MTNNPKSKKKGTLRMKRLLWLSFTVLALNLPCSIGAAEVIIQLPTTQGGNSAWIGLTTINGQTRPTAVTQHGQSCYTYFLSQQSYLTEYVKIRGGNYNDLIAFTYTNRTFCGYNISPFYSFNGWSVQIFGYDGTDILIGGPGNVVDVLGGSGTDYVQAASYAATWVSGGPGNDVVMGYGAAGQELYGDDGDDRLCASFTNSSATVKYLSGGNGWDTRCGSGTSGTYAEAVDCSAYSCGGLGF